MNISPQAWFITLCVITAMTVIPYCWLHNYYPHHESKLEKICKKHLGASNCNQNCLDTCVAIIKNTGRLNPHNKKLEFLTGDNIIALLEIAKISEDNQKNEQEPAVGTATV